MQIPAARMVKLGYIVDGLGTSGSSLYLYRFCLDGSCQEKRRLQPKALLFPLEAGSGKTPNEHYFGICAKHFGMLDHSAVAHQRLCGAKA